MGDLTCKTKCYCGRLFQVGDKTTHEALKNLVKKGMDLPTKHFSDAGSAEAFEAEQFDEAEDIRNFLRAHGVDFHAKLGVVKLRLKKEEFEKAQKNPLA